MPHFSGDSGMARLSRLSIGLFLCFLAGLPGPSPARAAAGGEEEFPGEQGPFEARNQFPFNLLFFQFPARAGRTLLRGEQWMAVSQTYANTFAGSEIFFSDFSPLSDSRQRLSASVVDAAQAAKPGQSLFFVDTEQGRTELRWRAGITQRFEAGVEVPFLSYRGGAFDGLIENYHRTLGFPDGGRDQYVRNLSEFALTLGGKTFFTDRTPDLYQLGDVSLLGRFQVCRSPRRDLALSAAVKLPTGDPDHLGGSGGTDFGAEVEGTQRWGRHRLHYGAGWVRTGGWSLFPRFRPADTASLLAGYEFAQRRRLSWVAQVQSQTSVFRDLEGKDPDLAQPANELLAGLKWSARDERWSFEAAFIENLFNVNNGADIGFRAGVAFRIAQRTR
jgi:hypothetical protein